MKAPATLPAPRRNVGKWLVSGPPLLYLLLFFAIPTLIMVLASFRTAGEFGGLAPLLEDGKLDLNLDSYGRFFTESIYAEIFLKSVWYALFTTLFCLLLAYPLAALIAKSPKRYRDLLLLLVILPFWSNFLIRVYAWMIILGPNAALARTVNAVAAWLGHTEPIALLFSSFAVLVCLVYVHLPFMVLPLYANLEKHDQALLDAAQDLGANAWQRFWRITFPLSLPGVYAGAALVFIPALGIFAIPDILGGPENSLIGNVIKQQFLETRDWPFGSVLSIVLTVAALLLAGLAAWVARGNLGTPSSARQARA
jgi:spermidine/putrescine transport system permease protein